MGMKCVSQELQRELMFLLCPSSSQSIPRTTGIFFNNVLQLQRTSIMSMFFISPVSCGIIMCNTIVTIGLLLQVSHFHWAFSVGYGTWENLQYLFSRSSWTRQCLHPSTALSHGRCHKFHSFSCFPVCSKFESIQRSLSLTQEKKIQKWYFQIRIEELTEPTTLLVKNLLPLEDSS